MAAARLACVLAAAMHVPGAAAPPGPAGVERFACEFFVRKEVEDRAVNATCETLLYNPDCPTILPGWWNQVVATCPMGGRRPAGGRMFPSPADITKEVCEIVSQKQVKDKTVRAVCDELSTKFHVNRLECNVAMKAAWAKALAYCQPNVTAPSPEDIEKLVCRVASQKQIEGKTVKAVCDEFSVKFHLNRLECDVTMRAAWAKALSYCPPNVTAPSSEDIEKLIWKQVEDKAVMPVCDEFSTTFLHVNRLECDVTMKEAWAQALAYYQWNVTAPSPQDIERFICELASQKQIQNKAVEEVCREIAEKFPSIKINPDCKTVLESLWDEAVAMCPTKQETAPFLV